MCIRDSESNNQNSIVLLNKLLNAQLEIGPPILAGSCTKNLNLLPNEFADTPETIDNNNSVVYIKDGFTEGRKVIYHSTESPAEAAVVKFPLERGNIVYFGWGWWNAFPIGEQDGGWLALLNSTIDHLTCTMLQADLEDKYSFDLDDNGKFLLDEKQFASAVMSCAKFEISFSTSEFDCEDVGRTQSIELTIKDELERSISELVNIEIKDPNDYCLMPTSGFQFSGEVKNTKGEPMSDVLLELIAEQSETVISDEDGQFVLYRSISGNYEMNLSKEEVRARQVTTNDLRTLSNHLLGLEKFTSPYQYLAADMNGDGMLNVADIVIIKKLILSHEITESLGPNWLFIESSFEFSPGRNPLNQNWNVLQGAIINADNPNIDVIAIKSGDLDFSYR